MSFTYPSILSSTGDPWLHSKSQRKCKGAFTLVELLVVLFIFLLLASIALPIVKKLISDQKTYKVARSIVSFIDESRSRAIAQGRYVGIRIERLENTNDIRFESAASTRLRQLIGVPPYSGESVDAHVTLTAPTSPSTLATVQFDVQDNQLLALAGTAENDPIKVGDLIELPGGRVFQLGAFTKIEASPTTTPPTYVSVSSVIDLNSPVDNASTFPKDAGNVISGDRQYRIHRSPVPSSAAPLDFTRGVAIDLNYSGFGDSGNEFQPAALAVGDVNRPIDIIFGPDGRVESITRDSAGTTGIPTGIIYICLGKTDGVKDADVVPTELFSVERRATANIMSSESLWIVINPTTGRAVVSPFASVSDTSSIGVAIAQSRALARLSDTLDAQP